MKTKTFLLLCLFLGMGLTQLSAQNGKNSTGSVAYDYSNLGWWTPIYCDGVQVDVIKGMGDVHIIDHYNDGNWQREFLVSWSGVGTSMRTGETFTFKEQDKNFFSKKLDTWVITVKTHIQGDKGSLYNVSFILIWDGNNWSLNLVNATCTGNAK